MQENPFITKLAQGCGQAFLAFVITCALFGPKMYNVFAFSADEQKRMADASNTTGPESRVGLSRVSTTSKQEGSRLNSTLPDGPPPARAVARPVARASTNV